MGKPDGPYHVADIESYTELDLDRLSEAMRDGNGKASAPDFDEERGRTGIEESGAANTGQDTSESAAESTITRKRKRREPTPEQLTDRPRRQIKPIERLSAGTKDSSHRQAHMTTALAAAVSSGDMFTNLAVDQIQKEGTTKPRAEHIQREDFDHQLVNLCNSVLLGTNGRPESKRNSVPLRSMRYGGSKHHLQVPRYCHSSGYTESSATGWEK